MGAIKEKMDYTLSFLCDPSFDVTSLAGSKILFPEEAHESQDLLKRNYMAANMRIKGGYRAMLEHIFSRYGDIINNCRGENINLTDISTYYKRHKN